MNVTCPECQHEQEVPDGAEVLCLRCCQCQAVVEIRRHDTSLVGGGEGGEESDVAAGAEEFAGLIGSIRSEIEATLGAAFREALGDGELESMMEDIAQGFKPEETTKLLEAQERAEFRSMVEDLREELQQVLVQVQRRQSGPEESSTLLRDIIYVNLRHHFASLIRQADGKKPGEG